MIVIGSSTISANGSVVTINSPGGFGAYEGVRLTNYTANILILTNISGNEQGQSQELLLPLQQMTYHTKNVSTVPTVTVFGIEGTLQVAPQVLVEWSTNPLDDFIGTYPVTIGTPSAAPYTYVTQYTLPPSGVTSNIGANPFRKSITFINHTQDASAAASGILWSNTDNAMNWVGPPYTAGLIDTGSGRTVETTSPLFFRPTGAPAAGCFMEVVEESWGAQSTFATTSIG